jgi:nicotinamidase-related amidase
MNTPSFYHARRVGTLFAPRVLEAQEAGSRLGLPTVDPSKRGGTALLLVDCQVDFIHTNGALCVPGAVDDTRRTIEWIFANVDKIDAIYASLDTHVPIQIFLPSWWIDKAGNHPNPSTIISNDEVNQGIWRPLYESKWSRNYTATLESQFKKQLMIWPYHTMFGTPGHSLDPALYEAIVYHGAARGTQVTLISKGTNPKTENYSIFEPEVKDPTDPTGGINRVHLQALETYDEVYVAGQAKSHCVLESVISLQNWFSNDPIVLAKICLLLKMMSSVYHPNIDFEAIANAQFAKFTKSGMKLVK